MYSDFFIPWLICLNILLALKDTERKCFNVELLIIIYNLHYKYINVIIIKDRKLKLNVLCIDTE